MAQPSTLIPGSMPTGHQLGFNTASSKWDLGNPPGNLSTVAALPASEDVPLTAFALELQHALSAIGKPQTCPEGKSHQSLSTLTMDLEPGRLYSKGTLYK